jgi:hypothetical protein
MDFMGLLNIATGLQKEFEVEIPGAEYPKRAIANGCVEYLAGLPPEQ